MSGALYYPSWTLIDPVTFAEFLLYWDRLIFMTPIKNWNFDVYHDDKDSEKLLAQAHEEYTVAHVPSKSEKDDCHKLLKNLIYSKKFSLEKYADISKEQDYEIDANKLDSRTVRFRACSSPF